MIITDITVQKKNNNMRSVFVDNKYCLSLEDIDVYKIKIKIGDSITNEQIDEYKNKYEYSKARDRAINFVSYKKRTVKEVRFKLDRYGYNDEIIDMVIEKLNELNYLDDSDYTKSFIKEKTKLKPCGKMLLKYELKNKGISEKIIETNLIELDIDEYKIALDLAERKCRNIKVFEQKEKQKIYSFLQRRGFSNSIIIDVINNLIKNKDGNYEI